MEDVIVNKRSRGVEEEIHTSRDLREIRDRTARALVNGWCCEGAADGNEEREV